jgi:hypothetical protein
VQYKSFLYYSNNFRQLYISTYIYNIYTSFLYYVHISWIHAEFTFHNCISMCC